MKKPLLMGCILACALIEPTLSQDNIPNAGVTSYAMWSSNKQENENSSLEEVLNILQSKYNISILYKSDLVKDKTVKTPTYQGSVQEALMQVLKPLGLKFKNPKSSLYIIVENPDGNDMKISEMDSKAISKSDNSTASTRSMNLEMLGGFKIFTNKTVDIPVKGRVLGDEGEGLPGVSIVIKGSTVGTTTDATGNYSLNVPDASSVLVFSFIGFATEEILVGNRSVLDITLKSDMESLSEVVVVGYGTQKKTSVTGAISSVASKDISIQPVVNIGQALQGRVAGVTVVNNGAPGAAPLVRIRGVGTVNNANPLYVIDGFPTSDLNSINTKDIESIEVLKDASAAAIYGSRAANGVILVTTKKGTNKKLSVSLDSYYGVESSWRQLDLLNTDQYASFATDLMTNADIYKQETKKPEDPNVVIGSAVPGRIRTGLDLPINSQSSQTFRQTNTDWQGEMFRTAPIQQHKVEIAGGSDKSRVFSSFGYFDQEGIMRGTGYKRGDARFNSDHTISKRITFGQNFYIAYDERMVEQQSGGRTQLQHIIRSAPYFPVYNPDNYGGFFGAQSIDASDPENPVRIAAMDKQNQQRLKLLANAYADIKIFDFLTYRFQGGIDYVDYTQRTHLPAYNTGGGYSSRVNANIQQNRQSFSSVLLTNQLSFNKTFGKHTINATVVAEKQTFTFTQITGQGNNTQSNDIKEPVALANVSFNGERLESAIISYVGRINYDYNNKYLIGASFRRDGSSRFGEGNKWGSFPAVSIGWRIVEESFLQDNTLFNEIKLRASYGLTGNFLTPGVYDFESTVSGNQIYQFDKTSSVASNGYTIRALANSDLRWETTKMANIGVDLGILNNSITLSAEYFRNNTIDMILSRPIPLSYGYDTPPTANVGEVQNRGLEMQLGYNKSNGNFTFSASGNISIIKNEVLSLGDEGTTIAGGEWYGDLLSNTQVGQPIAYFNGYITDGLFQTQEDINNYKTSDGKLMQPNARPGDIKFKDINNDDQLNSSDKQNIGHFLPDFSYGINLSANWKGLDASLFLQGVSGNEIYSVVKYDLEGMTRLFNSGTAVLDRWSTPGQNTNVPRAVSGDPNGNARASNRFIEDGSYFRVKNLTIGYSIPQALLTSALNKTLTRFRIYVTTQNLLTLTKYKSGFDPEIGNRNDGNAVLSQSLTQGIDYGQFPQARSVVLGIQLGF